MAFLESLSRFNETLQNDPMFQRAIMQSQGVDPRTIAATLEPLQQRQALVEKQQTMQDVLSQIGDRELTEADVLQLFAIDPAMAEFIVESKKRQAPSSTIGKIQADIDAGLIDPETGMAALKKATTIPPVYDPVSGNMIYAGGDGFVAPQSGGMPAPSGGMNRKAQQRIAEEEALLPYQLQKEEREAKRKLEEEMRTPTEAQGKAFGFAERMKNASSVISEIGDEVLTSPKEKSKESIPLIGNMLISDNYQQARQAQRDWISANLRKESGAVIGDSEMELEIKKYFPVVGDSPKTIEQKRKSRAIAERGMIKQAGALGGLVELPTATPTGIDSISLDDIDAAIARKQGQ